MPSVLVGADAADHREVRQRGDDEQARNQHGGAAKTGALPRLVHKEDEEPEVHHRPRVHGPVVPQLDGARTVAVTDRLEDGVRQHAGVVARTHAGGVLTERDHVTGRQDHVRQNYRRGGGQVAAGLHEVDREHGGELRQLAEERGRGHQHEPAAVGRASEDVALAHLPIIVAQCARAAVQRRHRRGARSGHRLSARLLRRSPRSMRRAG